MLHTDDDERNSTDTTLRDINQVLLELDCLDPSDVGVCVCVFAACKVSPCCGALKWGSVCMHWSGVPGSKSDVADSLLDAPRLWHRLSVGATSGCPSWLSCSVRRAPHAC